MEVTPAIKSKHSTSSGETQVANQGHHPVQSIFDFGTVLNKESISSPSPKEHPRCSVDGSSDQVGKTAQPASDEGGKPTRPTRINKAPEVAKLAATESRRESPKSPQEPQGAVDNEKNTRQEKTSRSLPDRRKSGSVDTTGGKTDKSSRPSPETSNRDPIQGKPKRTPSKRASVERADGESTDKQKATQQSASDRVSQDSISKKSIKQTDIDPKLKMKPGKADRTLLKSISINRKAPESTGEKQVAQRTVSAIIARDYLMKRNRLSERGEVDQIATRAARSSKVRSNPENATKIDCLEKEAGIKRSSGAETGREEQGAIKKLASLVSRLKIDHKVVKSSTIRESRSPAGIEIGKSGRPTARSKVVPGDRHTQFPVSDPNSKKPINPDRSEQKKIDIAATQQTIRSHPKTAATGENPPSREIRSLEESEPVQESSNQKRVGTHQNRSDHKVAEQGQGRRNSNAENPGVKRNSGLRAKADNARVDSPKTGQEPSGEKLPSENVPKKELREVPKSFTRSRTTQARTVRTSESTERFSRNSTQPENDTPPEKKTTQANETRSNSQVEKSSRSAYLQKGAAPESSSRPMTNTDRVLFNALKTEQVQPSSGVKNVAGAQFYRSPNQLISLIQKITQIFHQSANGVTAHTSFKVDGKAFGALEIQFTKKSGGDQALILVESETVKGELKRYLPAVQDGLHQKGVFLSSLEVEVQEQNRRRAYNPEDFIYPELKYRKETPLSTANSGPVKQTAPRYYGYNTMEIIA